MIGNVGRPVFFDGRLSQNLHHLPGFSGQHGGLVDHAEFLEMDQRIEPRCALVPEMMVEIGQGTLFNHDLRQYPGLGGVEHHHHIAVLTAVGKGGPGLFVGILSVDDQRMPLLAELTAPVPHFFDKRAGGVVLIGIHAPLLKPFLNLDGGAESRHYHNILFSKRFDRD